MSYDVLILAIVAICAVLFAYRQGLKDGRNVAKENPIEPLFSVPAKQPAAKDDRINQIMSNIETYDGTAKGQKEVKT